MNFSKVFLSLSALAIYGVSAAGLRSKDRQLSEVPTEAGSTLKQSGLCMTAKLGNPANHYYLQMRECDGSLNQQFFSTNGSSKLRSAVDPNYCMEWSPDAVLTGRGYSDVAMHPCSDGESLSQAWLQNGNRFFPFYGADGTTNDFDEDQLCLLAAAGGWIRVDACNDTDLSQQSFQLEAEGSLYLPPTELVYIGGTARCPRTFHHDVEDGEWCNVDPAEECEFSKNSNACTQTARCINNKWSTNGCKPGSTGWSGFKDCSDAGEWCSSGCDDCKCGWKEESCGIFFCACASQ